MADGNVRRNHYVSCWETNVIDFTEMRVHNGWNVQWPMPFCVEIWTRGLECWCKFSTTILMESIHSNHQLRIISSAHWWFDGIYCLQLFISCYVIESASMYCYQIGTYIECETNKSKGQSSLIWFCMSLTNFAPTHAQHPKPRSGAKVYHQT